MELQLRSRGIGRVEAFQRSITVRVALAVVACKSLAMNKLLKDTPGHSVTLFKIFRFVTYAVSLKNDILLPQPSAHLLLVAPLILPQAVKQFLAAARDIHTTQLH